jgi:peptide/nickel transport system ATP-binding protein
MDNYLLEISDLRVGFPIESNFTAEAVRSVSINISTAETISLVGESGSGKSVTALSIMRLIQSPGRILGGEIRFKGRNLLRLSEHEMQTIRGSEISMIFQEPLTALNPAFTIGKQMLDVIMTHQKVNKRKARERVVEALSLVGIPSPAERLKSYPHQFSGGMRQRVLIAMAVACRPKLLIADEPTTALDVTVQAQIISLLSKLRDSLGFSVLFITHLLLALYAKRPRTPVHNFYINAINVPLSDRLIYESNNHLGYEVIQSTVAHLQC